VADQLGGRADFADVVSFGRRSSPPVDVTDEASIAGAAAALRADGRPVRLVFDATGVLHDADGLQPEKTYRQIDPAMMARAFAVNAIGPALLMKHLLPLLPTDGKSVFATLSAKVGSIGDNHIGGWYSYRASKAALNQLLRTASVEVARRHPDAICLALHPGTVDTALSQPFAKRGLRVRTPAEAAAGLIEVIDGAGRQDNGTFRHADGSHLPW
jgi:NAD(P)-dependent dehydrogenase (short-subunit alcohol dehydrogenase family)